MASAVAIFNLHSVAWLLCQTARQFSVILLLGNFMQISERQYAQGSPSAQRFSQYAMQHLTSTYPRPTGALTPRESHRRW